MFCAATSTVLPDMLLAKAVVMTSPLVATLGLSLMIPLSVLVDYSRGARTDSNYVFARLCVLLAHDALRRAYLPDLLECCRCAVPCFVGLTHLSPQFFLGSVAVFVGFQMEAFADYFPDAGK